MSCGFRSHVKTTSEKSTEAGCQELRDSLSRSGQDKHYDPEQTHHLDQKGNYIPYIPHIPYIPCITYIRKPGRVEFDLTANTRPVATDCPKLQHQ